MALLSIIIPTKNRYEYLFRIVEAILTNVNCDELEIIVQDNSDNNEGAIVFFASLSDVRIKYYYTDYPLPISDNVEKALEHVTGEYITFIGDDDFVAPNICDIVNAMKKRKIEALTYDCGFYWWESVDFAKPTAARQKMAFWLPKSSFLEQRFEIRNSKNELTKILKSGGVLIGDMPKFYHGIVSRKLLERLKLECGRYLIGSCPDICFATSIALLVDNHYHLNYPVTICGASRDSAAGLGARNVHFSELDEVAFLRPNIIQKWDGNIPRIWSPATIYAQTVSEVLKELAPFYHINYAGLYFSMLKNERNLMPYIMPKIKHYFLRNPFRIFKVFFFVLFKLLKRGQNESETNLYNIEICSGVDECMSVMQNKYKKSKSCE